MENSRLSNLVNTTIKNVNYSTPLKVISKRVILFQEHAIFKHNYLNFLYSLYINTKTIKPPLERLNRCHPASSSHLGPNFAPSWNLLEHKTLASTDHNNPLKPHQDKLLAHRKNYRIPENPILSRYLYEKHIIWRGNKHFNYLPMSTPTPQCLYCDVTLLTSDAKNKVAQQSLPQNK